MRLRICSSSFPTLKPQTVASPAVAEIRLASMRTVVVFPAPFGPSRPRTSALFTSSERPSTAVPSPNRFVSPTAEIMREA
jgi:hypothetical protein